MTVQIDRLNMLFRDFKVASDVATMVEMRKFEFEYTVYGTMYREEGKKYRISTQKETIIDYLDERKNFTNYPLPVRTYTLRTIVPAGTEEDYLQLVKIYLAQQMRDSYDDDFLQEFYALAAIANDDVAETILTELQEKMYGLYRLDNLILFEGLMDIAYRSKHLQKETIRQYEHWLEEEKRQLENDPIVSNQFEKKLYGIAYERGGMINVYYNAKKWKTYEKKYQLANEKTLVSTIFAKTYWYNYDTTLREITTAFEQDLKLLFDQTYFFYLKKIQALGTSVPEADFRRWQDKHEKKNNAIKDVIAQYAYYWQIDW